MAGGARKKKKKTHTTSKGHVLIEISDPCLSIGDALLRINYDRRARAPEVPCRSAKRAHHTTLDQPSIPASLLDPAISDHAQGRHWTLLFVPLYGPLLCVTLWTVVSSAFCLTHRSQSKRLT